MIAMAIVDTSLLTPPFMPSHPVTHQIFLRTPRQHPGPGPQPSRLRLFARKFCRCVQPHRVILECGSECPLSVGLLPLRFGGRVSAFGRERTYLVAGLLSVRGRLLSFASRDSTGKFTRRPGDVQIRLDRSGRVGVQPEPSLRAARRDSVPAVEMERESPTTFEKACRRCQPVPGQR